MPPTYAEPQKKVLILLSTFFVYVFVYVFVYDFVCVFVCVLVDNNLAVTAFGRNDIYATCER